MSTSPGPAGRAGVPARQEAVQSGQDADAPRRAELLEEIRQITIHPDTSNRNTRNRTLRLEALRQRTEFDWRL
jgi:hypothetical protein